MNYNFVTSVYHSVIEPISSLRKLRMRELNITVLILSKGITSRRLDVWFAQTFITYIGWGQKNCNYINVLNVYISILSTLGREREMCCNKVRTKLFSLKKICT